MEGKSVDIGVGREIVLCRGGAGKRIMLVR